MRSYYSPTENPEEFLALQRFASVTLPHHRSRAILRMVNSVSEIFALSTAILQSPPIGLNPNQCKRLATKPKTDEKALLQRAEELGVLLLLWTDPSYPEHLLPYVDAPPYLFVRGALQPEDNSLAIGIVGSRRATLYGRGQAVRFAKAFAESGITVISGGAAGIDTASHRATLEAGGRTIAVLGCGVDVPYPAENRGLFQEIATRGAILSEFALGIKPEPWHFPTRNRIIAGMSRFTLVIEAPEDSGALITANYAIGYGREVWAVPGDVSNGKSRGCHQLIRDGAHLADAPEDILSALNLAVNQNIAVPTEPLAAPRKPAQKKVLPDEPGTVIPTPRDNPSPPVAPPVVNVPLSADEEKLLAVFTTAPLHLDEAVQAVGLTASQGAVAATLLEMKKLIQRQPGNFFIRIV